VKFRGLYAISTAPVGKNKSTSLKGNIFVSNAGTAKSVNI
jgi:hypothetical protein